MDNRLKIENYDGLLLIYDTELGEESDAIGLASRKETVLSDGRFYIKTEITVKPSCPIHLISEAGSIPDATAMAGAIWNRAACRKNCTPVTKVCISSIYGTSR